MPRPLLLLSNFLFFYFFYFIFYFSGKQSNHLISKMSTNFSESNLVLRKDTGNGIKKKKSYIASNLIEVLTRKINKKLLKRWKQTHLHMLFFIIFHQIRIAALFDTFALSKPHIDYTNMKWSTRPTYKVETMMN